MQLHLGITMMYVVAGFNGIAGLGDNGQQVGDVPFQADCPNGTFVTAIQGRSGLLVDRLESLTCSDGSKVAVETTGTGGNAFEDGCETGFVGLQVHARWPADNGGEVTGCRFVCANNKNLDIRGSKGSQIHSHDCLPDSHVQGIYGFSGPAGGADTVKHLEPSCNK